MEWWQILLIVLGGLLVLFIFSIVLYKQFFKRFWDIVLSLFAIIILSPLLLVLTIVGAIAMQGNPFFVQKRPGKNERIFNLIKFRSMNNKKDKEGKLLPDEQRLSKYGNFLRSTSLDELPELFCTLIGTMSLIGPRPLLIEYLPWYTEQERHRHDVRPGLTGWAQVNGRNNLGWDKRFELDIEYVNSLSLKKDFQIFVMTVLKVLKHSDVTISTKNEGNMAAIRKEQYKNKIK